MHGQDSLDSLALKDAGLEIVFRPPSLWFRPWRREFLLSRIYTHPLVDMSSKSPFSYRSFNYLMLCCDPGIGWLVAALLVSAHHYQVGLVAVHLELVSCQVVGHEAELVTELARQSIQVTITNCIGAIICIHCNTSTLSTMHVVAWCSILIRLFSL